MTECFDVRFDWQRPARIGLREAVWGEHKTPRQIAAILRQSSQHREPSLVTRVDAQKASAVESCLRAHGLAELLHWHEASHCLTFGTFPEPSPEVGSVMVLGGGSSDLRVASEAQLALHCHGAAAELMLDVGVAGLHRLLEQLPRLEAFDVLIACAGMEGALPTVLAGLVPQPVIGVPVSVGYGVSAGGHAALDGMLASCAPGLAVVNIDNGFGAAMAALRILRSQSVRAS